MKLFLQVVASLYLAMVVVMVGLNYRLRGRQLHRHNNRTTDTVEDNEEQDNEEQDNEEEEKEVGEVESRQGVTVCFDEGRAGAAFRSLVTSQRGGGNQGRGEAVVEL